MNKQFDSLNTTLSLIHSIFNLETNTFQSENEVEKFCTENRAIEGQAWLSIDALNLILEKGHSNSINYFEDILHIRIVLFYYNNIPVVLGPYLSEEITIGQSIQICNQIDKKKMDPKELIIYYGKYPVIPEGIMNKIIHGISETLGLGNLSEHFTTYKGHNDDIAERGDLERISNANIEAHYVTEREYMNAIKRGNTQETLHYKKVLSDNAAGMWTRKATLQDKKFGLAVNRAMSRIAAYEAGVPAPIIHKITTKESMALAAANSESQMDEACETML